MGSGWPSPSIATANGGTTSRNRAAAAPVATAPREPCTDAAGNGRMRIALRGCAGPRRSAFSDRADSRWLRLGCMRAALPPALDGGRGDWRCGGEGALKKRDRTELLRTDMLDAVATCGAEGPGWVVEGELWPAGPWATGVECSEAAWSDAALLLGLNGDATEGLLGTPASKPWPHSAQPQLLCCNSDVLHPAPDVTGTHFQAGTHGSYMQRQKQRGLAVHLKESGDAAAEQPP